MFDANCLARLKYSSDDVVTFDPEKVIAKLRVAFPEAEVDPADQAAAEVERVRQFAESESDADPHVRSTMLRQIQVKRGIMGLSIHSGSQA